MVMEEKKTPIGQEPAPDLQKPQLKVATPSLSNLNDIQDVENETPPVPLLKFNTIADGALTHYVSVKWRYFFIVIALLQIIAIVLILQAMNTAAQGAENGEFDSGIALLYAYLMFGLPAAILGAINLITLPIYAYRAKIHGIGFALCAVSLIVSIVVVILAVRASVG